MSSSRLVRYLVGIALLVTLLVSLVASPLVMASQKDEAVSLKTLPNADATEKLELTAKYPTFEGNSGDSFDFEVSLRWTGAASRSFNLEAVKSLPKWEATVLGGYPQKKISAIGLEGNSTIGETLTVHLAPLVGEMPDPGNYVVTLVVTSGNIKESVDLTAKVVAKYLFAFYTTSGLLNLEATAGRENHLAARIQSTGSSKVTNIDFLSTKPEGWEVKFVPDRVDQVDPGYASEIDIIVIPPRQVVPGDYMLNLKCIGKEVGTREIDLRITVLTPTVWGWVGVIIVLLVIGGLIFMFRQLGRR